MAIGNGVYRCRKLNNTKISVDTTKRVFMPLPNDYSMEYLDCLVKIGLSNPLMIEKEGYVKPFKSYNNLFHSVRHIPPTNPTNDINMSPIEGYTFDIYRSIHNIQWITKCD